MARRLSRLLCALLLTALASPLPAGESPIFDVHIHYSHDVWDKVDTQEAISRLRAAGIRYAVVSSSGDEGTRRLHAAAPDLVIPALRPYRQRGDLENWMHDESVIPYLTKKLADYRYAAIGEFHLQGEQVDLPVVRQMVQLARQHNLILHAHADADAIIGLFDQYPRARVIWAHAGFEYASKVKQLLDIYPNLWVDLSFRWEIFSTTRFLPTWDELLVEHPDRFLLGIDTYTPERWRRDKIDTTLAWYDRLFAVLPPDIAGKIRYQNARQLFADFIE